MANFRIGQSRIGVLSIFFFTSVTQVHALEDIDCNDYQTDAYEHNQSFADYFDANTPNNVKGCDVANRSRWNSQVLRMTGHPNYQSCPIEKTVAEIRATEARVSARSIKWRGAGDAVEYAKRHWACQAQTADEPQNDPPPQDPPPPETNPEPDNEPPRAWTFTCAADGNSNTPIALTGAEENGVRVFTIPENGTYLCTSDDQLIDNPGTTATSGCDSTWTGTAPIRGVNSIQYSYPSSDCGYLQVRYVRYLDDTAYTSNRQSAVFQIEGGVRFKVRIIEDEPDPNRYNAARFGAAGEPADWTSAPINYAWWYCPAFDGHGPDLVIRKSEHSSNIIHLHQGEMYVCNGIPDPGARGGRFHPLNLDYSDPINFPNGRPENGITIGARQGTLSIVVANPLGAEPARLGSYIDPDGDGLCGAWDYRRWGANVATFFARENRHRTDKVTDFGGRFWTMIVHENTPAWEVSWANNGAFELPEGRHMSGEDHPGEGPMLRIEGLQHPAFGFNIDEWLRAGAKAVCFANESLNMWENATASKSITGYKLSDSALVSLDDTDIGRYSDITPGAFVAKTSRSACYYLRGWSLSDGTAGALGLLDNEAERASSCQRRSGGWNCPITRISGASDDDGIVKPDATLPPLKLTATHWSGSSWHGNVGSGDSRDDYYSVPNEVVRNVSANCRWRPKGRDVLGCTGDDSPELTKLNGGLDANHQPFGIPLHVTVKEDDEAVVYVYYDRNANGKWEYFISREIDFSNHPDIYPDGVSGRADWNKQLIVRHFQTVSSLPVNVSGWWSPESYSNAELTNTAGTNESIMCNRQNGVSFPSRLFAQVATINPLFAGDRTNPSGAHSRPLRKRVPQVRFSSAREDNFVDFCDTETGL